MKIYTMKLIMSIIRRLDQLTLGLLGSPFCIQHRRNLILINSENR